MLLTTWQEADGSAYAIPNETYYNNSYLPRFSHNVLGSNLAATLYQSTCLEDLVDDPSRNNPNNPLFSYDDQMLFNIGEDKVEACLITNDTIKQELFDYLIERSEEYSVSTEPFDVVISSFKAQMLSYDCNVTYTRPWNGDDGGNINEIWTQFLDIREECINGSSSRRRLVGINDENEYVHKYDDENKGYKILKRMLLFIVSWSWLHL